LILATEHGDLGLVSSLVDHGADLNSTLGLTTGSALYYAVNAKSADIAQFLLESGANINAGVDRYDPLHRAIDRQDIAMVELLLDYGANPNKRVRVPGMGRITPIERARSLGADEIVDLLTRHGGDS
jgi:ankyrin repeat protein